MIKKVAICSTVLLLAFILFKLGTGNWRHELFGTQYVKAWHISLPGYIYSYSPEDEVDLRLWVGTNHEDIQALNSDNSPNPEATAGLALKSTGFFGNEYVLKKRGDHWVLWKPHQTFRRFSWEAWYRVGPWYNTEL